MGEPVAKVRDASAASRYELRVGERLVGHSAYRLRNGRIVFLHTEVDAGSEGRGFGSLLAAGALDDARRRGLTIVPLCPFIAHYVATHPEYEELVAAGYGNSDRSTEV